MKKKLLVLGIAACMGFGQVFAQGGPGDGGPTGPPEEEPEEEEPTDPSAVPIDGGVGFLLAAGAGYGIKKLRSRKKLKSNLT